MEKLKMSYEKECCCICLIDFQKHVSGVVFLPCAHKIGGQCYDEFITRYNVCPICKHQFEHEDGHLLENFIDNNESENENGESENDEETSNHHFESEIEYSNTSNSDLDMDSDLESMESYDYSIDDSDSSDSE